MVCLAIVVHFSSQLLLVLLKLHHSCVFAGHSDPCLSQCSSKQVMSSCGPAKKIPSKTSHHDSTLLPTVHVDHQHGSHTSQKCDAAFPATSAAPGSVAAACSECPEQGECTGVSSACELPFLEHSVQENDLLPAAEDALPGHRQAHLPGQPGGNTNSSSLDARILLDHLDSLDTQNVFGTCSGLEFAGQIKLELCRDIDSQVDAFRQSTKYLETLASEEQCNGNSWTAERSINLETGPADCSRQVDVINSSLDAQSASGQRSGRLETVQDILWGEDQAGQPVVLETVVLTGDQPANTDGQAIVCTLYNSSLDQGEMILSCDNMSGTPSCMLEADVFATESTYSTLAHQLLEVTEASQGNIVGNSSTGFPQLSDVYAACETVPSQPPEVTMVGQGIVASDSRVRYPQVLEMELDTLTTTCEAVISQPSKGILASQGRALCDNRIGFPRVLDLDMLASASEAVVSQPSDVTLACQDGSLNQAGVSGDTLSCSSFANETFVLQQPNDVRSSNRVHLTDTLLLHTTAAVESEKTATQGPSDLQFPLPVADVAIADQQSGSAPNTSMEIQTDASLVHLTEAVESEKTSVQAQTDHEFPLPVTDIVSTDQQSNSAPNTSLEIETDKEKKQSSVCSARSRPKRCYEKSDKHKAEKESTTKCPRLFPPRLCNTKKSAQETHASSQKDGESNGGEIHAEGMEASLKSPVTLKVPFQIKQYPENIYICPFDSDKGSREVPSLAQFPLDEATGRISTFLALTEKCQAGSREASEKLKRIISTRSIGKVKTGLGEFCLDGNYIRQKTVRQMLQDTGFERQECDIKLPVGRPAHKLRNGLHTHKKLSPQKPDPGVLNGKGEAGKKRKAEEPALAGETDDEALQHRSKWKIARCMDSCKNTDLGSLHRKSSEQTETTCEQNTGDDAQCGEPQITGEQSAQDDVQCQQQSVEQSIKHAVQYGEQSVGGDIQYGEHQNGEQSVGGGSVQDVGHQTSEQRVRRCSVQDREQQDNEQRVREGSVQDGEQQTSEQSVKGGSVQDGEQQASEQSVREGSVQDGEQQPAEQPTGGSVKHGEQAAEQSGSRVLPPPCVEHKSNEQKEVGGVAEAGLCMCSEQDQTNKENKKWVGTGRARSGKQEKRVQNETETVAGTVGEGKETAVSEEQSVSLIPQSPRQHGASELCEECGKQVVSRNVLCGEQLETSEHAEKMNKDFDKMVAGAALHGRKPRGGKHDEGATLCDEHHDTGEQAEETDGQMEPRTVLPGEQQHTFEQRAGASCDQVVVETHSSDEQQRQKSEDTAQCQGLEQQKEQEKLLSMRHPNIEDQGVPDDPEVLQKCQSSRLEEPCSFSHLEPHIFPHLEPRVFPHLESKPTQHQVDKGTGKQTLKVCGWNQTLPNGVSTADQFRKSRKRSKSDKQSKRDQSHGQETKGAITAGESSTCAPLHNRKKLNKAPDSILFDIEGEGASKSTHVDAGGEEGDSCSITCTDINGREKSGCIHVNAEDECDSNSICFDIEDRRSPNAEDYNPDFRDLGGCGSTRTETKSKCHSDSIRGSTRTETKSKCHSDSIPIGTKVKDGFGCVHTDIEGEQQSVCINLEAETTLDIKDRDDFDGIQTEAQSKNDCDNPPTDARSKEDSDSVNVSSDDERDKDCSLNDNAVSSPYSGGALQSQTVITIPSCESVNFESSVQGVCDEESTIVAESHSMNDPASLEDCDCESENQAVITSTANPELDLNSLPIVEKHGKFLDSETLHNGDIETLYRTPFILVIHQSPQSASQSSTSKADARDTVTEGTAPVSAEEVTGSLHENNPQTGAKDSGVAVHSATHKSHAAENLLYTENMLVSVPTDTPDFVDLKDLLELDCQGEPPDSDSHSLLVDNETLHSLGTRLSCSGSADVVSDSTRYSSHGPRYAAEGSLTEDGGFLGASSYVMGNRVVTASAAQTGFTGDSTCTIQPAFVPLITTADLPEEDDVTAMPCCASVEDGTHLAANYIRENLQGAYALESGRMNASAPTTHFPSLAPSSTPSTMRLADFVGECTPVTALEDFMGDCFSGAPVDLVGDCSSTVSPELVGDTASASRQEAGGGVVDFSAVASAGFHAPVPLPNLTDTAEVSKTLTGSGMHPRLVCAECLNPDGPYGQSGQNGTKEVAGGVACQVHCVDGPGSVSAQISPRSESKDSFVFESRCDVDRLTPALPAVSITKPEEFLPVVQEFRVLSVSEHDGALLNSDSHHSKSSGTCESTHAELHMPEVADSIEKSEKKCSTSSHHQNLSDGSDENPVFQELQRLNQNFVVGTKMLTEHENHIQNTLHASEPDPLEIWMEYRPDSANQSVGTQNVKNASENGSPNNKFLVVVEAPKTAVPEAQDIVVDSCIENYFPDLLTACLDSSLWKPDANIPRTHESSTDSLTCFTMAAVGSDTPTNVFESGDDVQNQNNSGDSNSCFDMLFQALDQHSVSACSGQPIHSAAVPPIKSECKALHMHDSCPSLMPVQDPCPAVLGIQHSHLTAAGVHDACSAVTLPDVPSPSPVVVDVPASSEAFGRHASSSGDKDHFRTEAIDDVENVYLSQISLSTTFPETVCSYTSFESAKLKVTDPLKILEAQDSGHGQQALSSCPPETFTLSDLASLLPGNMSKSDAASVPGASIRPSLSLTSLTDVQDCVSSVNLASVMGDHQFPEVGDVVSKDKSLDNGQSHVPRQSSPFCTPGFSYTTIPASLAVSCAPLSFGGSQLCCSPLSMASNSTATAPITAAFSPPKDKVPVISASSHLNSQLFLKQENKSSSLQPLGRRHKAWSKMSESDSIPVNLLVSSLFQGQIPSTTDMISVTSTSALPVCIPTASGTSLLSLSGSSGLSAPSSTVTASAKHVSGLFETKPVLSSLLQVNPSHPGPALGAEGACSLTGLSSSAAKLPKGLSSFSCKTVTSSLSLKQHSVARTHSDTSPVDMAHSCLASTPHSSDPPNPALETSAGSSMHQSADTPGVTLPPLTVVASGRTSAPTPIGGTFSPDSYSTALELLSLSSRCAQFSHPSPSPVGAGSRNMFAELSSRSIPACLSRAVTSSSCSGYGSVASIYASSTPVCAPECSHVWSSAARPVDSSCLLATTSVSSAVAVTVRSRTAKPSAHWSSAACPVDSLCSLATPSVSSAVAVTVCSRTAKLSAHLPPLTLSSVSSSALWTPSVKFVVTPVPSDRSV